MGTAFSRLLAIAAALSLAGGVACSFLEDYDWEGKPCASDNSCRLGFVCTGDDGGVCVYPDAGEADAGAGHDAGR